MFGLCEGGRSSPAVLAPPAKPLLSLRSLRRSIRPLALPWFGKTVPGFLLPSQNQPLLNNRELQSSFLRQNAIKDHLQPVSCAESAARALSNHFVRVFTPCVAVVAHRIDGYQSFDEHISQFNKQAKLRGVQHQRGKLLADPVFHEANLLPLDQFALGLICSSFGGFLGVPREALSSVATA